MTTKPVSKYDLKSQYPLVLRISLIINLLVIILLFVLVPKWSKRPPESGDSGHDFDIVKIPIVRPPEEMAQRPRRPLIPVEVEGDDLIDDVTIETGTNLDEHEPWDEPPPPSEDLGKRREIIFTPHDEKPEPIGGYKTIIENVEYPPMALEVGLEGRVLVCAYIDEKGDVGECWIVQGIPNSGFDEAAIKAIRKTKFKPAKQRDISVAVYLVIPIEFKLE